MEIYTHAVQGHRIKKLPRDILPPALRGSDLFGLAWRGSEVKSTPRPQYLIWRQARRGPPLQILA
jgi:hypothetical protein